VADMDSVNAVVARAVAERVRNKVWMKCMVSWVDFNLCEHYLPILIILSNRELSRRWSGGAARVRSGGVKMSWIAVTHQWREHNIIYYSLCLRLLAAGGGGLAG
jgi:hypothetical protein